MSVKHALLSIRVSGNFHATEEGERDLHNAADVLEGRINKLEAALQPFADQAKNLRSWQGGPPLPAHAFYDEILHADEVLS